MPAQKIYRWGFVGAGWMAQAQAHDLAHSSRNRPAAVVSRTRESAQTFANEFGAVEYQSLEKLVADETIDLIYITSPNHLHYPQVKLALQAGKPVLCEKPFTLNAGQLAELIEIARRGKLFLMEAMWVRYLPSIVKLRELIAAGAIGRVNRVGAAFHLQLPVNPLGRIYSLSMGGGSLLDLGIYPISFASMVLRQQPHAIVSQAEFADTGVDVHFEADFSYLNGGRARVSAGVDESRPITPLIEGDRGSILVSGDRPLKFSRLTVQANGQPEKISDFPLLGSGYSYQADEVARCLDAGELESGAMPLDESLAIMQTLDALRRQWNLKFPGE